MNLLHSVFTFNMRMACMRNLMESFNQNFIQNFNISFFIHTHNIFCSESKSVWRISNIIQNFIQFWEWVLVDCLDAPWFDITLCHSDGPPKPTSRFRSYSFTLLHFCKVPLRKNYFALSNMSKLNLNDSRVTQYI